jgi:hypothetical protein
MKLLRCLFKRKVIPEEDIPESEFFINPPKKLEPEWAPCPKCGEFYEVERTYPRVYYRGQDGVRYERHNVQVGRCIWCGTSHG